MIRFRTIFLVLIVITILVVLSPLILGLAATVFSYEGKCYGFPDGVWSCPWYEYAAMQIFYSGVFAIPFALTFFSGWLVTMGFWFQRRRTSIPDQLPLWQVMLIPMFGCIGGAILVSALSIAINIYYKLFH